ncbi:hypothetical protein OUZ56_015361 [Daphnia magna]|uniref:Uncharacterized protein n=1 Tax=Daphnia magna TaxID=35525 RepID=A0ABR0AMK8_9CRUS|nr:hypothetical protein OUZ56_015361 [Daphnia magna]
MDGGQFNRSLSNFDQQLERIVATPKPVALARKVTATPSRTSPIQPFMIMQITQLRRLQSAIEKR